MDLVMVHGTLTTWTAAEINAIGWVFTGIAIAAVSLKLFARLDSKRFGWDDFFIFFSLVREKTPTIFLGMTNIVNMDCYIGSQHHCHGIRLIFSHSWSRPAHCNCSCWIWDWEIREISLLADYCISFQHRYVLHIQGSKSGTKIKIYRSV